MTFLQPIERLMLLRVPLIGQWTLLLTMWEIFTVRIMLPKFSRNPKDLSFFKFSILPS